MCMLACTTEKPETSLICNISRFRIPERKWLFLPLLTGRVPNKTFPSTQFHIWWSRSAARSLKSFSFLLSQFQIAHSINVGRGTLSWIFNFCNLLKLPFKRDLFYNIFSSPPAAVSSAWSRNNSDSSLHFSPDGCTKWSNAMHTNQIYKEPVILNRIISFWLNCKSMSLLFDAGWGGGRSGGSGGASKQHSQATLIQKLWLFLQALTTPELCKISF